MLGPKAAGPCLLCKQQKNAPGGRVLVLLVRAQQAEQRGSHTKEPRPATKPIQGTKAGQGRDGVSDFSDQRSEGWSLNLECSPKSHI